MITRLINQLLREKKVFAPIKEGDNLFIREISLASQIDWSAKISVNSWKNLFLPSSEDLFYFKKDKAKETTLDLDKNIVALGMNILDLKALGLFDLVFSHDAYYQRRREKILVIGLSGGAPTEFRDWQIFSHNLEENILEHLPWDIFLEKNVSGGFKYYESSEKGKKILEKAGIKNYQHIQFSGLIPEEGPDKKMLANLENMKNGKHNKVWQELGKICIACGKCSMVCPTCFCFDIYDEALGKEENKRIRSWGNCFYPDFSKISEGHVFLDEVAKKIHFWYEHKFFRIPSEYKIPGCVSCLRCNKVCPVGIKIEETLKKLSEE